MINLIFRYVSVWALTFVAFWSEETSSVNVVRRSAIFVPDLNLTQAANWLCRNTFQDDIRGLNVYWSVLVKRYLLHLQGGIERRWKGHTVWLLPRDPDDTVGHHIVLHTKETHLDPRQLPSFPGGPFFFFQDSLTSYSESLTGLVLQGGGTGRRHGNQRVFVLLIW